MADLRKEELEGLARLSRVALTKEESDALLPELEELLSLAACLKDEEGLTGAADLQQTPFVTRNDEVKAWENPRALLACAPEERDGFFLVSFEKEGRS